MDGGGGATAFADTATAGSAIFNNFGGAAGATHGGLTLFTVSSSGASGTFNNNGATASGSTGGSTHFIDTSTAGAGTFINSAGTTVSAGAGVTAFTDTSTAGSGNFTNDGATIAGGTSGATQFSGSANAGSGVFTSNGGLAANAVGGTTAFSSASAAGAGIFTANGSGVSAALGGTITFTDNSSAGAATLIANGGTKGAQGGAILFGGNSIGSTARIEVFDNGSLDISNENAPGLAIGSIEGTGAIFLGSNNLTIGANNMNTTLSGSIQDGGVKPGIGGSLTKSGMGTLTLSGTNLYTGPTLVTGGILEVGVAGSLSASTSITVQNGAFIYNSIFPISAGQLALNGSSTSKALLGGNANIAGSFALTSTGDILSPGNSPGTLAFVGSQAWKSFSYQWQTDDFTGTKTGKNFDVIDITGSLNLTGGAGNYVLDVASQTASDTAGAVPDFSETMQTWDILTSTTGINGFNATDWTVNTQGFANLHEGQFVISQVGNNLVLTYTVPEPSTTWLFGVIAVVALTFRVKAITVNRRPK